nr:MAG TPA: hypothetical protein [Caudoviricetes sp.]
MLLSILFFFTFEVLYYTFMMKSTLRYSRC